MRLLIIRTCTVSLYENAPYHCLQHFCFNRLMPYQVMVRNKGTSYMYARIISCVHTCKDMSIHAYTASHDTQKPTLNPTSVCVREFMCVHEYVCVCVSFICDRYVYDKSRLRKMIFKLLVSIPLPTRFLLHGY